MFCESSVVYQQNKIPTEKNSTGIFSFFKNISCNPKNKMDDFVICYLLMKNLLSHYLLWPSILSKISNIQKSAKPTDIP